MNAKTQWVNFLREQFPPGTRVVLREMKDPYHPVPAGTKGEIRAIDDAGTVHVAWENGSSLGLIPGEDRFSVLPAEPEILKLYIPLTGQQYSKCEWGDGEDESVTLHGADLVAYRVQLTNHIQSNQLPEEEVRGLMAWYGQNDAINQKVLCVRPEVEIVDGALMGVAVCTLQGILSAQERLRLQEYIEGQMADGWGEGFEQQPIRIDGGELYVSFWSSGPQWCLQTKEELQATQEPQLGGM